MKLLRETIRKILLENYELTDEDIETARSSIFGMKRWSDERIRKELDHRGQGLQGTDPIERDKQVMRDFHKLMQTAPGKKMVENFMNGNIDIRHSLTYTGNHSEKEDIQLSTTPFTDFVERFGKQSRDQISCCAASVPIGEDPKVSSWSEGNGDDVFETGYGFVMKGYPAFVASEDFMSQTLSAIPQSLKDFNKSSGQVKRSHSMEYAVNPMLWDGADEVLLDNWQIVGVYISEWYLKQNKEGQRNRRSFDKLLADAKKIGVPIYVADDLDARLKQWRNQ